ncbi:MAG: hypothetical protein IKM85_00585 [Bacteroidales bacterium]|nr:hypothetical protein [Bacteroidales bacterium]
MSETSREAQIRCLEEMVDYLKVYCREMQESIDDLNKSIRALRELELTTEFEDYYEENYFRRTKNLTDQVQGDILHGHIRYLEEVIDHLKSTRD